MSVQSVVGNITHDIGDGADIVLNQVRGRVEALIGSIGTGIGSIWDGGFVGMSLDGKEEFKTQLGKYITDVQAIIQNFNANAQIDTAIKGTQIEPAVHNYLDSMKRLLEAYVSMLKQALFEIDEAYENFVVKTQGSISSDVEQMSSDIKQQAEQVKLD